MPTWNKELHSLTKADVEKISLEYLMGWQDLMANGHSFRIKGFNHMREKYGMEPLTRGMSFKYRINYIKSNYTDSEILNIITDYLKTARVGDTRWTGIELFGCRFGREYARAFKTLLGSHKYRQISEKLRNMKSIQTQIELYGGVGLAGESAKQKAIATNLVNHGGENVMDDFDVRVKLASINNATYGGPSPFSDKRVRQRSLAKKSPRLISAMRDYKQTGKVSDLTCESMPEFIVFKYLVDRFGPTDVYSQYGIHPYDSRYPYNCDFYVKSLDLFIELNIFYVHGGHWFDDNDNDDKLKVKHWLDSGKAKNRKAAEIWSAVDVEKRMCASKSKLNYLVFWDDVYNNDVPRLKDFKMWFFDYDCDYESFIKDYPKNTY